MKRSIGILLLAALAGAAATNPALSQGALPVLYTASQAAEGATVYAGQCAACHGPNLEGTSAPALKGDAFHQLVVAQKLTPGVLFAITSQTMPLGGVGTLTGDQYRAVTAFLLQQNGYPAGDTAFVGDRGCSECDALLTNAPAAATPAATPASPASQPPPRPPRGPVPETVTAASITAKVDVTLAQQANAAKDLDNWLLFGRTYDNQRFSPLTQINMGNVKKLAPVAIAQTGILGVIEGSPIVVDGMMYISTTSDRVFALDAVSGRVKWTYTPTLAYALNCCGPASRGVAVAYGKVFMGQLDGRVVALDARTGKLLWKSDPATTLPENPTFYSFSAAPQVYDNMVVVGNAGGEFPTRGFMEALDQATGKLIWRFNTTAAPGEPGGDTWSGDSWKVGGGGAWNTPALDTKNGILAFATGNPNPVVDGSSRLGDNAYTVSIVGVNAKTGKFAWYYQMVPHDVWDYDAAAPVVMFDADDGTGKRVPAAGEASKEGLLYIVNRLTGKLLRKAEPFTQQSANRLAQPAENGNPATVYPGAFGGNIWSPASYSPLTHDFYVPAMNMAFTYTVNKDKIGIYQNGTPVVGQRSNGQFLIQDPATNPAAIPVSGTFTALNVDTGKIAWQYKSPLPMQGGSIVTASNLLFTGELNGDFMAFNARTGKKLWSFNLGTGVATPPVTYRVKGVQYVAVAAAGGNGLMARYGAKMGLVGQGDVIAIFALPRQ